MTRILVIAPNMGAAARAILEGSGLPVVEVEGLAVSEPLRVFPEPVYKSPREYEPPNDVRRLRRQQYARERRTPPQLSKGKGRR
ncbi:hypothetical protein [Cupriavidus pauculus]|uniref:hypothetical protein n=1 Tax=Cupriavidus pauculus TaxID=82633 RepID=UPI001D0C3FF9|nr:hypothetical protein [Cupriavidus pauculus]